MFIEEYLFEIDRTNGFFVEKMKTLTQEFDDLQQKYQVKENNRLQSPNK